ncbi:MAG TPA: hypothetical protein VJ779_05790 [Acetobacteraceae bacterium]|nr:hypothetical protein [Acetobacteraceae bacterium]
MRRVGVFAVAIGALVAAGAAGAGTTSYYRAGPWRAFSGTDEQNRLVCGMATSNGRDGRTLEIRAVIGDPGLAFLASKPTWDIPPGTKIPVVMQAAGAVPWTQEAVGEAHALRWKLPETEAGTFEQAFRDDGEMTVSFPSGNEPPWRVLLAGSTSVDNTFRRCVQDYSARAAASAQPPTQPFGQPSTQPFAPAIASTPLPPPAGQPADAPASEPPCNREAGRDVASPGAC